MSRHGRADDDRRRHGRADDADDDDDIADPDNDERQHEEDEHKCRQVLEDAEESDGGDDDKEGDNDLYGGSDSMTSAAVSRLARRHPPPVGYSTMRDFDSERKLYMYAVLVDPKKLRPHKWIKLCAPPPEATPILTDTMRTLLGSLIPPAAAAAPPPPPPITVTDNPVAVEASTTVPPPPPPAPSDVVEAATHADFSALLESLNGGGGEAIQSASSGDSLEPPQQQQPCQDITVAPPVEPLQSDHVSRTNTPPPPPPPLVVNEEPRDLSAVPALAPESSMPLRTESQTIVEPAVPLPPPPVPPPQPESTSIASSAVRRQPKYIRGRRRQKPEANDDDDDDDDDGHVNDSKHNAGARIVNTYISLDRRQPTVHDLTRAVRDADLDWLDEMDQIHGAPSSSAALASSSSSTSLKTDTCHEISVPKTGSFVDGTALTGGPVRHAIRSVKDALQKAIWHQEIDRIRGRSWKWPQKDMNKLERGHMAQFETYMKRLGPHRDTMKGEDDMWHKWLLELLDDLHLTSTMIAAAYRERESRALHHVQPLSPPPPLPLHNLPGSAPPPPPPPSHPAPQGPRPLPLSPPPANSVEPNPVPLLSLPPHPPPEEELPIHVALPIAAVAESRLSSLTDSTAVADVETSGSNSMRALGNAFFENGQSLTDASLPVPETIADAPSIPSATPLVSSSSVGIDAAATVPISPPERVVETVPDAAPPPTTYPSLHALLGAVSDSAASAVSSEFVETPPMQNGGPYQAEHVCEIVDNHARSAIPNLPSLPVISTSSPARRDVADDGAIRQGRSSDRPVALPLLPDEVQDDALILNRSIGLAPRGQEATFLSAALEASTLQTLLVLRGPGKKIISVEAPRRSRRDPTKLAGVSVIRVTEPSSTVRVQRNHGMSSAVTVPVVDASNEEGASPHDAGEPTTDTSENHSDTVPSRVTHDDSDSSKRRQRRLRSERQTGRGHVDARQRRRRPVRDRETKPTSTRPRDTIRHRSGDDAQPAKVVAQGDDPLSTRRRRRHASPSPRPPSAISSRQLRENDDDDHDDDGEDRDNDDGTNHRRDDDDDDDHNDRGVDDPERGYGGEGEGDNDINDDAASVASHESHRSMRSIASYQSETHRQYLMSNAEQWPNPSRARPRHEHDRQSRTQLESRSGVMVSRSHQAQDDGPDQVEDPHGVHVVDHHNQQRRVAPAPYMHQQRVGSMTAATANDSALLRGPRTLDSQMRMNVRAPPVQGGGASDDHLYADSTAHGHQQPMAMTMMNNNANWRLPLMPPSPLLTAAASKPLFGAGGQGTSPFPSRPTTPRLTAYQAAPAPPSAPAPAAPPAFGGSTTTTTTTTQIDSAIHSMQLQVGHQLRDMQDQIAKLCAHMPTTIPPPLQATAPQAPPTTTTAATSCAATPTSGGGVKSDNTGGGGGGESLAKARLLWAPLYDKLCEGVQRLPTDEGRRVRMAQIEALDKMIEDEHKAGKVVDPEIFPELRAHAINEVVQYKREAKRAMYERQKSRTSAIRDHQKTVMSVAQGLQMVSRLAAPALGHHIFKDLPKITEDIVYSADYVDGLKNEFIARPPPPPSNTSNMLRLNLLMGALTSVSNGPLDTMFAAAYKTVEQKRASGSAPAHREAQKAVTTAHAASFGSGSASTSRATTAATTSNSGSTSTNTTHPARRARASHRHDSKHMSGSASASAGGGGGWAHTASAAAAAAIGAAVSGGGIMGAAQAATRAAADSTPLAAAAMAVITDAVGGGGSTHNHNGDDHDDDRHHDDDDDGGSSMPVPRRRKRMTIIAESDETNEKKANRL